MHLFICVFFLFAMFLAGSIASLFSIFDEGRIIGGFPVEIKHYPYQANVQIKTDDVPFHLCGGSIYSENIIITAAHCIVTKAERLEVTVGSSLLSGSNGVTVPVKQIIKNELYSKQSAENDIAILVLDGRLPLDNVTIQALELAKDDPKEGEIVTVTGWGFLKPDSEQNSNILYAVQVPIISSDNCKKVYEGYRRKISDAMLCAGYRGVGGKDACQGDSGGPLVFNNQLVGVVSFGHGCASDKYPGVYARISYLRPWLLKKIAEVSKN